MRTRTALAVATATFILGVLIGLAAGTRGQAPAQLARPAHDTSNSRDTHEPTKVHRAETRDEEPLRKRIQELEAQLRRHRTKQEKIEFAKRFLEAYRKATSSSSSDPETLKTAGQLGELDTDMACYFLEQARIEPSDNHRNLSLSLALLCGGKEVTDFLVNYLTDPNIPELQRQNCLNELSGIYNSLFAIERIPMNEELAQTALLLAKSQKREARMGAAGLLGGSDSDVSRAALLQLAETDVEHRVRAAALMSLGRVGDERVIEYLGAYEANHPNPFQDFDGGFAPMLRDALKRATELAKKRFPR